LTRILIKLGILHFNYFCQFLNDIILFLYYLGDVIQYFFLQLFGLIVLPLRIALIQIEFLTILVSRILFFWTNRIKITVVWLRQISLCISIFLIFCLVSVVSPREIIIF